MIVPPKLFATAAGLSLLAGGLSAQNKPARLTFEVASIKPSDPSTPGGGIKALPGGQEYRAQRVPVLLIVSLMYKVPMRQITGGPGWLATDLWDIQAKADRSYNLDDLHTMFQNLLTDEFKLRFHKENREGSVYALVQDKSGSKMKANTSEQDFKIPLDAGPDGAVVGTRVPMPYFAWWLGQQVVQRDGRPVIDRTGLAGNYDFTLSFAPDLPPNVPRENLPPGLLDRPTIFDALRQQLGLKLEPGKGPVEFYVIDGAEKPSAN
jgi:uncharacterized protein (TIGR03435 family)